MNTLRQNKLFLITGIVALALIYGVFGNATPASYMVAGLWFGFWTGIFLKKSIQEKKLEVVLSDFQENENVSDLERKLRAQLTENEI